MYLPDAWWIAVQVFDACGASDEVMTALGHGLRWIRQVALPHVPAAFRDSFLERNATNRALLAAATRRTPIIGLSDARPHVPPLMPPLMPPLTGG
jgi:hypothetical protein